MRAARAASVLDAARIGEAALALVDERGLDGLTMRALGERLGVDPTAVYRHYRNKDELLESLVSVLFDVASGDEANPARRGAPWRDVARVGCEGIRRSLLAHPALVPLAVTRPPRTGGSLTGVEVLLGALRDAGFDDADAAAAYHTLLYFTLGHAALEAPYAAMGAERAAEAFAETRSYYLAQAPRRYPNVAAVAPHLYGDLDEQFAFGLGRILDGLEASLLGTGKGPRR